MHRVDNSTSVAVLPTPSAVGPNPNSYFSPGDPGSGTPATRVNYDWANAIQEELCYVIEQAGLTLDKTVRTQLKTAIDTLNQKNTANYTTSTTAANTYTATLTPALTAYTNGMIVFIKFTNANSGAATINLNSLGAKSITDLSGAALTSGVIAAGMVAVLAYDGTNFQLLNGVTATLSAATQAEMETATATNVYVTPGRVQYNPGVAKAWINFNGRGTIAINASHNVTSITDNGTGDYTITLSTAFSTANYAVVGTAKRVSTDGGIDVNMSIDKGTALTTTAARVRHYDVGAGVIDPEGVYVVFLGDQ